MTRRVQLPQQARAVTLAPCDSVCHQLQGGARLLAMLPSALAEALSPALEQEICQRAQHGYSVAACLLLPDWLSQADCQQLQQAWQRFLQTRLPGVPVASRILQRGTVAAWEMLEAGWQQLQQHPHTGYLLLAAVDSWCEASRLKFALQHQLLLSEGNQDGFVAGEAAAAVVLQVVARTPAGWQAGLPAPAPERLLLHRPALDYASYGFWPQAQATQRAAAAQQLRHTLAQAMAHAGLQADQLSHLASDMDGSGWRAQIENEALSMLLYHGPRSAASRLPQQQLAGMLGQTGCVSGLLPWALQPHLQRIQPCNSLLHWSVAASGQTAACVLERSSPPA